MYEPIHILGQMNYDIQRAARALEALGGVNDAVWAIVFGLVAVAGAALYLNASLGQRLSELREAIAPSVAAEVRDALDELRAGDDGAYAAPTARAEALAFFEDVRNGRFDCQSTPNHGVRIETAGGVVVKLNRRGKQTTSTRVAYRVRAVPNPQRGTAEPPLLERDAELAELWDQLLDEFKLACVERGFPEPGRQATALLALGQDGVLLYRRHIGTADNVRALLAGLDPSSG